MVSSRPHLEQVNPGYLVLNQADETLLTNEVKPYIEQTFEGMNAVNQSVRIDPSYTEQPDYGDGWELATKIFETGSRSAMLRAEAEVGTTALGPQFNECKLTHLLLNQWGYSVAQEAEFHLGKVGERLAMVYSRGNLSLVERKLSAIISLLHNRFGQKIVDIVEREMSES